ncbi:MAG: VOC family protein [Bryobacterales bacterium]|nr:VOC family protein [Bryobacterales bacterium]
MTQTGARTTGSFCWLELATSDIAAAKRFYGELFGWIPTEITPEGQPAYTRFRLHGRDVAGCYHLDPAQCLGVPPHWVTYIQVEDAESAATRALSLGGKLVVDPFDVLGLGRAASLQDPCGAYFCIWQPGSLPGFGVTCEPGSACWHELTTPDPERARDFYTQLFAWETATSDEEHSLRIKAGGRDSGGILPLSAAGEGARPSWTPYFRVEDCDQAAVRAREMGGAWRLPPAALPGMGRFAVLEDPQGAVFAIVQMTKPGKPETRA